MSQFVRIARASDRPTLSALQSLLPESEPALLEAVPDQPGLCLVSSTQTDQPAGYLLALPGRTCAWILELVVAPQHRRTGKASALLSAACRRLAQTHRTVRLAVRADNDAAIACYRSCGFERVGTRPELYEDGTAVVFERAIDREQPAD